MTREEHGVDDLRAEDIRAFVHRDWNASRRLRPTSPDERDRGLRALEQLRMGDALRQHAYRIHPDWPTETQRQGDLESHVRWAALMERLRGTTG